MDRKNYDAEISLEKYHWWYVTRRSILKNICDNYIKNKKELSILEIGCGSGGNLSLLSRYGELYAMESDDFAIKNANSKKICEVRKGMLPDNIPYGKSFDIICLFDVLEHIQDDKLSLQTVNKYLNSDGKIIITVPAYMFCGAVMTLLVTIKGDIQKVKYTNCLNQRVLKKVIVLIFFQYYSLFLLLLELFKNY